MFSAVNTRPAELSSRFLISYESENANEILVLNSGIFLFMGNTHLSGQIDRLISSVGDFIKFRGTYLV